MVRRILFKQTKDGAAQQSIAYLRVKSCIKFKSVWPMMNEEWVFKKTTTQNRGQPFSNARKQSTMIMSDLDCYRQRYDYDWRILAVSGT